MRKEGNQKINKWGKRERHIYNNSVKVRLKESCFPDCWKVLLVVPVFKNVRDRSTAKNYQPVGLLSVVSKVFEKLVNNRIVDHQEKCGLFDFQYGFRSFKSIADLPTAVSDKIVMAFNRSGTTQAEALDISKASKRNWHGLFHKLSLLEFQIRYSALFFFSQ